MSPGFDGPETIFINIVYVRMCKGGSPVRVCPIDVDPRIWAQDLEAMIDAAWTSSEGISFWWKEIRLDFF